MKMVCVGVRDPNSVELRHALPQQLNPEFGRGVDQKRTLG